MKVPSLEEQAPGRYSTCRNSTPGNDPAVRRRHRTPDSSSRVSWSSARWREKNPSWPRPTTTWGPSWPASRPSTETPSRLTMSNSLLTDGWALPVSIWDRALALIPRRLAISRRPILWPRRSARSRPPRSRAGGPAVAGWTAWWLPVAVMAGVYRAPPAPVQRHWTRVMLPPTSGRPRRGGVPMADRLLLRGGTVLTVDSDLGDLPKGDVLIEGDTIAQVAPQIDADAEVIDASGRIVIPGFVDTHRHTWETAIRGCAPN